MTKSRTPRGLPFRATDRLSVLSTAGAAFAAVGTSQAAISFIDLNDAVVTDPVVGDTTWGSFVINFNGDATGELAVAYRAFSATAGTANVFPVAGVTTTAVIGIVAANFNYPSRLTLGASVGASGAFIPITAAAPQGGRGDLAWGPGYTYSRWDLDPAAATGYLGVRFQVGGNTHFGWVRLTVDNIANARRITVHDAAWEMTPGQAIPAGVVPEPGIGLLALGGIGLMASRRRRSSTDA